MESLAHGLKVLAAFEPSRPEMTQREIAEVAGVSVPSGLRIGHTLVELGYLIRNPSTLGYRLGPKSLTLGMATLSSMSLPEIVQPTLSELRDHLGETIKIAVLHGVDVVYIGRFAPPGGYLTNIQAGSKLHAAGTSIGRAILSGFPREEALSIVERTHFEQLTEHSRIDVSSAMAAIEEARSLGYALNDQEVLANRRAVAVAISDYGGRPVAGINVSVWTNQVSVKGLLGIVSALRQTAAGARILVRSATRQVIAPFEHSS